MESVEMRNRRGADLFEVGSSESAQINTDLLRGVYTTGKAWWAALLFFGTVTAWAFGCFVWQIVHGIDVYGMQRPNYWGLPIINFVYWAGVALSGTMISAILRLLHADWRRALTRMTETLTLCALMVAGLFPIIHLGRNWAFFWLLPYPNERQLWPNYRSPLLWDATAISVYLISSAIFWYIGLIPDFALIRDRAIGWRRRLYAKLALGWRGTDREWRRLRGLSAILTVMIIPVFVSLHTIVGWDFGMTIVPGWHETIFAPYFVCGALYSGTGSVLIIMAVVRRAYRLEKYILPKHFDNIGKALLAISLLWFYFFAGDAWSDWFSRDPSHIHWLHYLFGGYRWVLLTLFICGIAAPMLILPFERMRRAPWVMFAVGLSVNVAMFSERCIVVIPPASRDFLTWGNYTPSWVGVSVTAGAVGLFGFLYTLMAKFVPLVSLWEIKEGERMTDAASIGGASIPLAVREEAIG
ncbi:molybdopterin oxidoreductase membrane subunit [Capsulimonas corticalis]|uniref:Molybdopterin oxidoreductase membrane subunit n=1 Tax=Capsulimonas corticalis TaxID=2219043 RepID=A0A402CW63_9BACT|nr:NrfD/PsrC family molybdoenzyme membrane anchor subunit [Capsulimonas corticalis]BDI34081.1 molybdopterin oxidoreductase membrane subunit [Capsulimonas corticalis]